MNCKRIEKELSAYLDGEVQGARRQEVEHHLASCDACRARLARLRRTAALVAAVPEVAPPADLAARVLSRVAPGSASAMSCLEASEQVHAYADGWLAPAAVARLEAHLRDCPECEAELRRVRAVKAAMASLPEVAPPPAVRETVAAAVAARQARPHRRLRPWVWGAIGTSAAAAAACLLAFMTPQTTPDSDRVATPPRPAPVEAIQPQAPMVADVPESADETPGPATSLFGRLMHRVTGIREREATEPEHATVEPVVPPTPKAGDDGDLPAPAKTAVIKGPTVVEPEPEPEVSVEPYVVAVVLPPDAPETDAWEAVGVKHVADESPPAEETVAAAPRVFRFSQPVEHKEVVIRASGSKRRGGPLRGSDGGYVEVVTGSL